MIFAPTVSDDRRRLLTLFTFIKYLKPLRWMLIGIGCCRAFALFTAALSPLLTRAMIDHAILARDWQFFQRLALATLALVAASFVTGTVSSYWSWRTEQQLAFSLQRVLQRTWQRLPISYFTQRGVGDHIYHATTDVYNVSTALLRVFPTAGLVIAQIVVSFAISATLNLRITLLFSCALPVLLLIKASQARRLRPLQEQSQSVSARINNSVADFVDGITTTKLYCAEKKLSRRCIRSVVEAIRISSCRWRLETAYQAVEVACSTVWNWALVFYGLSLVLNGTMTLGTLIALRMYLGYLMQPFQEAAAVIQSIVIGSVSAERLRSTFTHPGEDMLQHRCQPLTRSVSEPVSLRVAGVHFGYGNGLVLRDMSVSFEGAGLFGVTGRSGGGKTTLVALLTKLCVPSSGEVSIDGLDIASMNSRDIRRCISVVPQQKFLLPGTIRENIALGDPFAEECAVIDAANRAEAHEFISKLPNGYNTAVNQGGVRLSAGQAQRICIARAMYRTSRVMIIDEGMNAVDRASKRRILESLKALASDRVVIVISHDAEILSHCERVYVLGDGKLVGSHTAMPHEPRHTTDDVTMAKRAAKAYSQ